MRLAKSGRSGRKGEREQSAGQGRMVLAKKKKKTSKETIMEKCKHAPRNSFDEKSPNIPPSCPQLSSRSFRSPPTALGCQATAVLLKLCQGDGERAGKNRGGKKRKGKAKHERAMGRSRATFNFSRRPSASGGEGDRPSDTPPPPPPLPPTPPLPPSLPPAGMCTHVTCAAAEP